MLIFFGIIIFGDHFTLLNGIGFSICIIGILIYKLERIFNLNNIKKQQKEEEEEKLLNDDDEDSDDFGDDIIGEQQQEEEEGKVKNEEVKGIEIKIQEDKQD